MAGYWPYLYLINAWGGSVIPCTGEGTETGGTFVFDTAGQNHGYYWYLHAAKGTGGAHYTVVNDTYYYLGAPFGNFDPYAPKEINPAQPNPWTITVTWTLIVDTVYTLSVSKDSGVATVTPANGTEIALGDTVNFSATLAALKQLKSAKLDGVEKGALSFSFTATGNHTIVVETEPLKVDIDVSVSYIKTDCLPRTSIEYRGLDANGQPQSDGIAMTMGGTVYGTGLTPTVCNSEEPVSTPAVNIDAGSSFGVWAVAHDVRTRLVSLTVNGNDYVSNPSGGALPNQFVYCGSGVAGRPLNSGGLFFDVPGTAISISAVFASDMVCVNRLPQLPKSGPVPPAPPAPGQPYPNPFPVPTAPNPFPIPVPGDTYPIPGFIPDGPEEGNPGDIPGGPGDDGGGGGGSTGGGGTVGSPFGTPESVRKVDQLGETSPRGLIIRWRNDAGKWSKEHVIDLGTIGQTNLFKQICPMGEYVTRQWEIIHIDAIPFAVVYLEEEVEKRSE